MVPYWRVLESVIMTRNSRDSPVENSAAAASRKVTHLNSEECGKQGEGRRDTSGGTREIPFYFLFFRM